MRRRRDTMLPQDLKVWAQDYPDRKSAAKAARLASKVIHSGEVHVRKTRVYVKTTFSADAWSMTFVTLLTMLRKYKIANPPEWIWKYANECADFSREHKTWYLKRKDDSRVSCLEFMNLWQGIIPMKDELKHAKTHKRWQNTQ